MQKHVQTHKLPFIIILHLIFLQSLTKLFTTKFHIFLPHDIQSILTHFFMISLFGTCVVADLQKLYKDYSESLEPAQMLSTAT